MKSIIAAAAFPKYPTNSAPKDRRAINAAIKSALQARLPGCKVAYAAEQGRIGFYAKVPASSETAQRIVAAGKRPTLKRGFAGALILEADMSGVRVVVDPLAPVAAAKPSRAELEAMTMKQLEGVANQFGVKISSSGAKSKAIDKILA